jgi:hypothetical protein
MWAINNMFGTGTRRFAIITSLISCGTYAVVFGLLHPPSRKSVGDFLGKVPVLASLRNLTRDALSALQISPLSTLFQKLDRKDFPSGTAETAQGGKKGKETAATSKWSEKWKITAAEVTDPSQRLLAKGKASIINQLRRTKPRGQDHELGEVHEVSGR